MFKNIAKNSSALVGSVCAASLGFAALTSTASAGDKEVFEAEVIAATENCAAISLSCAANLEDAAGVLIFPNVVSANLIVGGSGGKGVLVENGHITGHYKIGGASAGLQAGIDGTSQIYVFPTDVELNKFKDGGEWNIGATADITVIDADASAQADTSGVLAYIFNSEGLEGGVSIDVFRVWETEASKNGTSM
ncbi:YSC84-related protein [Parvularcula marina]|uniref:lipid-binding SYLF domain-containing protein n=1 Tax=Parvularcula marina TaxID=2292771 RepID=UPI003518B70C